MTTLFFSFSAQTVFKNFFFFEGSLFDMLKQHLDKHEDICIVLLLPEISGAYDSFFSTRKHPHIIIEKIPFPKERRIVERALRFFYSYFIYTGTTRIMATIGIRPDEPPAGGKCKQLLAPLKIGIAKTFGRMRLMRQHVIPFLFYRIFRERPFSSLFEIYKPDLIFMPHLYGFFDTMLLAEAKKRKVKTIGMVSNWDHFDKYYLPFQSDILLAQSEQIKDFAIRHQWYDPATIHLVGYPTHDFIFKNAHKKTRRETLVDLRLPPDARYILYISGSAYCKDEPDIIEEMLKQIGKGRFGDTMYLVIRPYAGTRPADREYDKEKFDRFLSAPRARTFAGEFWGDVAKTANFVSILEYASVVHVVYSTAALEAAVLDKPLVAPTFDGYHIRPFRESIRRFAIREHFRDVLETGALKQANNFDELFLYTDAYLTDPSRDKEKRELLRRHLCFKIDGRASERIFQHIVKEL